MKKLGGIFLLLIIISSSSCKKAGVDTCIEKFVGTWGGPIQSNNCSSSISFEIKPGTQSCELLFPNLPAEGCHNNSYQVLGTVSGDSVFIATQPFGLNTITAHGAIYLNQMTFEINGSNGYYALISATK